MNPDIAEQIITRLKFDYDFKKESNGWLQQGKCPDCGKKELFIKVDSPWLVKCGRENNCGAEISIREIYPDIFEGFNKRYKPTESNPNATADAYLTYSRGFDTSKIKGFYEQGKFWHPDADKGTATVRFYLDSDRTIYMERFVEEVTLIDHETGEKKKRKAHFKGSHQGLWWQHPGMAIEDGDEVWLVEGCLDAIALFLNGIKAVATLSCVNFPDKMLAQYRDKDITWVWALDNDKAGRKYTRKHVKRMQEDNYNVTAAQAPGEIKDDWNDLHKKDKLTDKAISLYLYHGQLLLVSSASEKSLLIYKHTERREFHFNHNHRLYWFKLDLDRYEKARQGLSDGNNSLTEDQIREAALKESGTICEIANCSFKFLYYQANTLTDESWYYVRVDFPHTAPAVKNTFTGGQLSSASEFKKRLLSIAAGSVFTGSSNQLDRILKAGLNNIKTVQTIDFIGYSKEHGVYVFNDIAVKDGQRYALNNEDFFDCGKLSIKTLNQSMRLHINADREKYTTEWVNWFYQCFGSKGLTALAFWLGSLFSEQIRQVHKSYPFIEIIGEPGAGKTTLIEFLWKLVGRRDYEGFDPSKATPAARARNFAQTGNLPVSLIEADRDEDTARRGKFDWDELKTLYNGRGVRARGMKNGGNETYEPPFRGSIVISQNAEVNASEAVLQRIVHLNFTKCEHTNETKAYAEKLERIALEHVSHFILDALSREREVMETVKTKTPEYEKTLLGMPKVTSVRIAKNHAQMLSLVDALSSIIPITADMVRNVQRNIASMAMDRQQAINADHPMVQEFWEAFEYLNGDPSRPVLNHSKNKEIIAVNLNHFVRIAGDSKQQIPPMLELKRHLKTSKLRKYIGQRATSSNIEFAGATNESKTVKCWLFTDKENSNG